MKEGQNCLREAAPDLVSQNGMLISKCLPLHEICGSFFAESADRWACPPQGGHYMSHPFPNRFPKKFQGGQARKKMNLAVTNKLLLDLLTTYRRFVHLPQLRHRLIVTQL